MKNQEPSARTTLTSGDLQEMLMRLGHEIRNPLASIKSSAQIVRELKMSPEQAQSYLDSIVDEVERLHQTVKELERFASLEEGVHRAVLIRDAVSEAVKRAASQAEEVAVGLTVVARSSTRVVVDARHLQLALDELLTNALGFSKPGSEITISWQVTEGWARITVADEGPGVSEEHASRILKPFFSSLTQGIGLGLNLAQRVCLLAGGRLEWKNLPQGGCCFGLVLRET